VSPFKAAEEVRHDVTRNVLDGLPVLDGIASPTCAEKPARAGSSQRLKRELSTFLQEVTRLRPLVVFLDDVHWADPSTVDLLAYLATKFASLRTLIIATYRPSELLLGRHPFLGLKLDLQARGVCHEMPLEFLRRGEVEAYLALEFPGHRFPAGFTALVYEKTEGSPLFMVDLLRYLRGRAIVEEGKAWVLVGSVSDLSRELPESRPPDIEPASDVLFLRIVEADDLVSETEARAGEDRLSGVEVSADSCDGAGAVGRAERRERDA